MLAPARGALMLSLLESVDAGLWEDSGPGAASAILIGAGMPPERATGVTASIAGGMAALSAGEALGAARGGSRTVSASGWEGDPTVPRGGRAGVLRDGPALPGSRGRNG
ncbi:hypothetical protein ABZ912_46760 [Nonomuraea angiospora]|uniref:hypothetical protein n=1 Tax=Nonomuraea angiospora TaxID=46172 RepID=UPI0033ECF564